MIEWFFEADQRVWTCVCGIRPDSLIRTCVAERLACQGVVLNRLLASKDRPASPLATP